MPPYQKTPQKPLCSFYAINKTFDRVQMKEIEILNRKREVRKSTS